MQLQGARVLEIPRREAKILARDRFKAVYYPSFFCKLATRKEETDPLSIGYVPIGGRG